MTEVIPISQVRLPDGTEERVLAVLRSGRLAQGPVVEELEARFAELTGVRSAVAVNNGTTALIAALSVLDLGPGDEVVTSPFTFVATLNAILAAGATARFADIDDSDFNVDAASAAALVGTSTVALLPVHLFGQCADLDAFSALADRNDLHLVEDAAQAHGASAGGRRAGSVGTGCFSFYATKNLTTGEGGMVTTDDEHLADRLRLLRNQGMRARYEYEVAGNNFRMTDLQAAVGLPQIDEYRSSVRRRAVNAAFLSEALADVEGLVTPRVLDGREHVWHQFTVRVTDACRIDRDELARRLERRGVGSGVYYPRLVFDYDCYRDHPAIRTDEVPVAARVAGEVLSLPVHPDLTGSQLDRIASSVVEELGR